LAHIPPVQALLNLDCPKLKWVHSMLTYILGPFVSIFPSGGVNCCLSPCLSVEASNSDQRAFRISSCAHCAFLLVFIRYDGLGGTSCGLSTGGEIGSRCYTPTNRHRSPCRMGDPSAYVVSRITSVLKGQYVYAPRHFSDNILGIFPLFLFDKVLRRTFPPARAEE